MIAFIIRAADTDVAIHHVNTSCTIITGLTTALFEIWNIYAKPSKYEISRVVTQYCVIVTKFEKVISYSFITLHIILYYIKWMSVMYVISLAVMYIISLSITYITSMSITYITSLSIMHIISFFYYIYRYPKWYPVDWSHARYTYSLHRSKHVRYINERNEWTSIKLNFIWY